MKSQKKNNLRKNKKTKKNIKRNSSIKKVSIRGGASTRPKIIVYRPQEKKERTQEFNNYEIVDNLIKNLNNDPDIDTENKEINLSKKLTTLDNDDLLQLFSYYYIKNLLNVEIIDISNNNFNANIVYMLETIPTIKKKLQKSSNQQEPYLKSLNVSSNNLGVIDSNSGHYGYEQVYYVLHNILNGIEILNISNSNIGDDGAIQISNILNHDDTKNHNKTLKELDISNNKITQIGGIKIGMQLANNKILQKLNISNNKIGDVSLHHIIVSLNKGLPLTTLNISNTGITNGKVSDILKMLKANKSLTTFNISDNSITNENMDIINNIMKSRKVE